MMNNFKKKNSADVKPILKDKEKEDKGLALQLVPEYVDKRAFQQGNHNPNYVFAGALYIPKDIIKIVNSSDNGAAQIHMGPVKDGGNVFQSTEQSIDIEDPDVRKYITRILRYFKYDPEEAMTTLREASFKIKNRARGIVKRTYSQNTVTKLQAWRAKIKYSEGESEEDLISQSHSVFGNRKLPLAKEEEKDESFYDGDLEEVNKQSFMQRTFTRLFPTKSPIKIDKNQMEFSSDMPYSEDDEKPVRSKKKGKAKKCKSMSQLTNEGNKQVKGFLSTVTTDPEEKNKKNKIFNLNKILSNKIKKITIMLKTIYQKKSNIDNKAAKNPINLIYCDMFLNYQEASIKKNYMKCGLNLSKQDELVLSYLTAPRIHYCDTYTVMILNNENPQNIKSHNRKRILKKMKQRLQSIETLPYDAEFNRRCNASSLFDGMLCNESGRWSYSVHPDQQRSARSDPCLETYNDFDDRTSMRQSAVTRQTVDILADTFVNVIDEPNDPKCKVEITGDGYKGKFNVGLDPIIDQVLYHSLQNLKETYENSKYFSQNPTIDRRRTHTIASIAGSFRNYLMSKVSGKSSVRNYPSARFSSNKVIGRTSIQRGDYYEDDFPQKLYEDIKHRRCQQSLKRNRAPSSKISRYLFDNQRSKCQPKYRKRKNVCRTKKKRNINSSGSESFEERKFVRKTKCPPPILLESSDDSFLLRDTSSTQDESIRLSHRGGSTDSNINKKGLLKTRDLRKQSYCPDLSYISERDWKAAAELLRKEREASNFSHYVGESSDKRSLLTNQTGNSKVVSSVKETMTKTANGVTTVTQTEVIEAINQSSQCLIPSTSKDAFPGRKEFNAMPMTHHLTKAEESGSRLENISQRQRNLCDDINGQLKKGINHESVMHKNKENVQRRGRFGRECRCYEDDKRLNTPISTENLTTPSPGENRGYNHILTTHNADRHGQKDSQKFHCRKGHCYCNPCTFNKNVSSRGTTMTPHREFNDITQNKVRDPKKEVIGMHRVQSDPINICCTKYNLRNITKDEEKVQFRINALTQIEQETIPILKKRNLQERNPFEKFKKQGSQTPEEVIVTDNGKAKIRVSLGSCETTQRQQALLELMEVLKRKLESENQFLTNDVPSNSNNFHDFEQYTTIKGLQANKIVLSSKNKIDKGLFEEMNKTATVAMTTTDERPSERLVLRPSTLRDCKITTKRNLTSICHRPCLCEEQPNKISRKTSAEKSISIQPKSFDFKPKSLKKEETLMKPVMKSASVQTDDIGLTLSGNEMPTSLKPDLQKKRESIKLVSVGTQTDDFTEPTALSLSKPRESQLSIRSKASSRVSKESSIFKAPPRVSKESCILKAPSRVSKESSILRARESRESRPRIKTGSLFSKSLSEKTSRQASRWLSTALESPEKESSTEESMSDTNHQEKPKESSILESSPRKSSKKSRKSSEKPRKSSGKLRKSSEKSRKSSEKPRKSSEKLRKSSKKSRKSSEKTRKSSEKPRKSSEKSRQSSIRRTDSSLYHSVPGRSSTRSGRGTLFVRRSSTIPSLNRKSSRQSSKSPVINQRVWIQTLSLPVKYAANLVKKNEKKTVTKALRTASLHKLKLSNVYSDSSETDDSFENLTSKMMSKNTYNKINRNILPPSEDAKYNVLSSEETDENSILYSTPKQSEQNVIDKTPIKKVSYKPLMIDSVSHKSSSLIDTTADSIHDTSNSTSVTSTINYVNSRDSTSVAVPKYTERSIISDGIEKSSCSLLSYEESPSIVNYVENFQYLPSLPLSITDNSINTSTSSKSFRRVIIPVSKSQPVGRSSITFNKTIKSSHIWPSDCDCTTLKCFPEKNKSSTITPGLPRNQKKQPINVPQGRTSLEGKPSIPLGSEAFKGHNSSSSGSSDSRTTVISAPMLHKKHVTVRLQNFIATRALDSTKPNSKSNSPKKRNMGILSTLVSEKNKSLKSKLKRSNIRPLIRRNKQDSNSVQNRSIGETISSDEKVLSDVSTPNLKHFDEYPVYPSTSHQLTGRNKKKSDVSEGLIRTSKRSKKETANLKKTEGKPRKGKKFHSTSVHCNLNSTLCINDETIQNTKGMKPDMAKCTTIGYDCSNVSLKEGKSKITKCYKVRAMDQTVCSSTAWIVNSSDSDIEKNPTNSKNNHERSKRRENHNKSNAKYLMLTKDLHQSSSELLAQKGNTKGIFIHKKRTIISDELDETNRKHTHTLLRKKRNETSDGPNDGSPTD